MQEVFGFWEALEQLRAGNKVSRVWWYWDHFIHLQIPDENSKMNHPYIYIKTELWDIVPWTPSQTDILTSDWRLFY